jgi:SRSO17 transposase
MTEQQIAAIGPAFATYLAGFRAAFADERAVEHLRTYCRGLLSDLPRKSVEPIALAAGTAVRTLQEFLRDYVWDAGRVRDAVQQRLAPATAHGPDDGLGTVGLIDETSAVKKGAKTPGVQRQYLGCVGKTENGIVTVHLGVTRGRFKALLDADLYLPQSWDDDRARCDAAGIPAGVTYRPKWQIALGQVRHARANGVRFDWLTFDEAYTDKPGFLAGLEADGQVYVGEAPADWPCESGRADAVTATHAAFAGRRWRAVRIPHQTEPDAVWQVKAARVRPRRAGSVVGATVWLIVARRPSTGEVKYFVSNAPADAPVARLVRVAFTRWNVEHCFRVSKTEIGLTHYEGRNYVGLMRHLVLCLVVLGFVALHAERLRGEKSGGDVGASVPRVERPLPRSARPASRHRPVRPRRGRHSIPPSS